MLRVYNASQWKRSGCTFAGTVGSMPMSKRDWNQTIRGLGKLGYTPGPGQKAEWTAVKVWCSLGPSGRWEYVSKHTVCILAPSLYGVGGPDQDAWMENSATTPGWTVNMSNG